MKQFYCTDLRQAPYAMEEIQRRFPQSAEVVSRLGIGQSATDADGDTWFRTADLVEGAVTPDVSGRDERLERIATAAMAAIIGKLPLTVKDPEDTEGDEMTARGAVTYAKALIAELDKQA